MLRDVMVVGTSYIPLGEYKLCTSLLDKQYVIEDMKQIWIRSGFIVMDGWIDI